MRSLSGRMGAAAHVQEALPRTHRAAHLGNAAAFAQLAGLPLADAVERIDRWAAQHEEARLRCALDGCDVRPRLGGDLPAACVRCGAPKPG